ncbi:MAG: hypothetical protein QI197_05985 [Candidatus Korarchaeota archaeon]|nr:hypothetical protein [Candidatus Korarchaeota archaeon]
MVKFGFLARGTKGKISLSRELAERYLREAPVLLSMGTASGPIVKLVYKERRSDRALRDAMEGKATLSDTLAFLMDISITQELENDLLVIYAWLYRKVLGSDPPIDVDIPDILPKFLEDELDDLRSKVLEIQLERIGML